MPRPSRIQKPNLTYHVVSQCLEWRDMIAEEYLKELFLSVLRRSKQKYRYKLVGYCIMPNHIHLLIRTVDGGTPISRIVQYIKARFAELYNKLFTRSGPFWHGRYKDTIIERAAQAFHYLLWLLWYIAFNPVREKLCQNPLQYRFSSIRAYLEKDADVGVQIDHHCFFEQLGYSFAERVRKLLQYEEIYRKRYSIIEWI
ncbi:MAG: transposase [Spirochaetes bacterium]|nr:transposase [Spirochaetota bacterium]